MRITVSRAPGAEREVSPLELFFDLIYVFAVGQLSHLLALHVDLRTDVETLVLGLAVFYAWYMTAWGANWLEAASLPVRGAFVGLMFVSLFMSVAIHDAFGALAGLFVSSYLLLQVGRAAFLIMALRGRPQGEHFLNVLVWEVLAGALWVAGVLAKVDARLALWGAAILVTYGGAWTLHWLPLRGRRVDVAHTEIAAGHLLERFRLFFIIVLGETVLTMGNAFAATPFEAQRLWALVIGFTGTVALWWCYFERAEGLGVEAAERAADAGAVGLWSTWALALIVLGLIGIAVGDELAIVHPAKEATVGFSVVAFGGCGLFLLAQALFYRSLGRDPRSRLFGLSALTLLGIATAPFTLIVGLATSTAVLMAVALSDSVGEAQRAPTSSS